MSVYLIKREAKFQEEQKKIMGKELTSFATVLISKAFNMSTSQPAKLAA